MTGVTAKLASVVVAAAGMVSAMWLPYQQAWINDDSDAAIWEKSRRIGADYCESFRCVDERISGQRVCDYWYSSADESAALEFAEYIGTWLKLYNKVAEVATDRGIDDGDGWLKMTFTLPEVGGRRPRITVMTSSPRRFRSKGGDVCLSELAFHEQAEEMWKAASPATTWGGRIRVLSSHNGDTSKFNRLLMQARKHADPATHGEPTAMDFKATVHRTDIHQAVEQGLCERINQVSGKDKTREEFIADLKAKCSTMEVWTEEYECIPSGQAGSYFPHALLTPCVTARAARPTADLDEFILGIAAKSSGFDRICAGSDVARTKDRFVIWVWGRSGTKRVTLGVLVLAGQPFDEMEKAYNALMNRRFTLAGGRVGRVTRLCIDKTGLGMQLAERMEKAHRGRVEGINFTTNTKVDMFTRLRAGLEDISIELPDDAVTHSDFSSVRKEVTAAGNVRYNAASNEHGHADRATAAALGLVADESARPVTRFVPVEEGAI